MWQLAHKHTNQRPHCRLLSLASRQKARSFAAKPRCVSGLVVRPYALSRSIQRWGYITTSGKPGGLTQCSHCLHSGACKSTKLGEPTDER